MTPAIFLDRDGTLMEDAGYCSDPALVRLFPGTVGALAQLKAAGYRLVIITNQSGIARGYMTVAQYEAVHARLVELLGPGLIDATYYCPDHPDHPSPRRKPGIGMVLEAQADLGLDLASSWFIGDKPIDVECGHNAGMRSILVLTGQGSPDDAAGAEYLAKDLADAAAFVLGHSGAS